MFQFDVQGQVANSTHAGIPWLRYIREQCRERVHFWPFDGWEIPAGHSVLAEVILHSGCAGFRVKTGMGISRPPRPQPPGYSVPI